MDVSIIFVRNQNPQNLANLKADLKQSLSAWGMNCQFLGSKKPCMLP
jgi:hypothetical protein